MTECGASCGIWLCHRFREASTSNEASASADVKANERQHARVCVDCDACRFSIEKSSIVLITAFSLRFAPVGWR